MVGQKIAIFTAIEVKSDTGKSSEAQKNFLQMVENFGGISGVARSVQEAQEIIRKKSQQG